jgi:hypothetical protein
VPTALSFKAQHSTQHCMICVISSYLLVPCALCVAAGLKHLDIKYCPSLTVKGCVHLTSLTALTSLKLQHCSAFADPSGTADLSAQGGAVSNICLWGKVGCSCSTGRTRLHSYAA